MKYVHWDVTMCVHKCMGNEIERCEGTVSVSLFIVPDSNRYQLLISPEKFSVPGDQCRALSLKVQMKTDE